MCTRTSNAGPVCDVTPDPPPPSAQRRERERDRQVLASVGLYAKTPAAGDLQQEGGREEKEGRKEWREGGSRLGRVLFGLSTRREPSASRRTRLTELKVSSGVAASPGKAAHNKLLAKEGQAEERRERKRER